MILVIFVYADGLLNVWNKLVRRKIFGMRRVRANNAYCHRTHASALRSISKWTIGNIIRYVFVGPELTRICLIKIMQVW